jgi:HEPN domain-containing protein
MGQGQNEKVSLEKFFGNSISKVKFYDQFSSEEGASQVNEENIEEVKQILEEYIESMYEEAESKLNKKYAQEMKKMTIKFKEA